MVRNPVGEAWYAIWWEKHGAIRCQKYGVDSTE